MFYVSNTGTAHLNMNSYNITYIYDSSKYWF